MYLYTQVRLAVTDYCEEDEIAFDYYKKMLEQSNINDVTNAMRLNGINSTLDFNLSMEVSTIKVHFK